MARPKKIRSDTAHPPPAADGLPAPPMTSYSTHTSVGAEYTEEQLAFLQAVDRYKRTRRRPCPTWTEILAIAHALGYRRCDVTEDGRLVRDGGAEADSAKHSVLPQI